MKKFFFIFAVAVLAISLTSCAPEVTDVNPFTATRIGGGDLSSGGGGALLSSSSSSSIGSVSYSSSSSSSSLRSSSSLSSNECTDNSYGAGSPLTYEGQTYKTVKIGCQVWMAENLNYNASGSKCYNNQDSYCNTYGRLYNWVTAMDLPASCNDISCASQINTKHRGICPNGWHLPSDAEWDVLMNSVGGYSTAGKHLKTTSGWNDYNGRSGNGEDTYGFSALPGGDGLSDGSFYIAGNYGVWWSATEYDSYNAYGRLMYYYYEYASRGINDKSRLLSVRCLQD